MKKGYMGGQILTETNPNIKKTTFSLAAMVCFIYCACAAGAFGLEESISSAGPGLTLILLLVLPVLWAMPIGLATAELTNLAPVEAGPSVWIKEAFGEFWEFAFGAWGAISLYLTGAAYVVLAVDYMHMFYAFSPLVAFLIKAGMIIVFTVINLMGLKEVNIVSVIFGIVILLAFLAVAVVGFCHWTNNPFDPITTPAETGMVSWGTGIAIGVWMFCGYNGIAFIGGEMENPQILAKGMKVAIILITLSYFLPTLAGIAAVGPWNEWGISIDYSSVLTTHVGKWAGWAFLVVAIVSNCALFNTSITMASRGFMVLAEDNLCPKSLAKVSPKRHVPVIPMIILAIVNLILVNIDFTVLVTILAPLLFMGNGAGGFAFLKLRMDYPVEMRGDLYYVKGGKAAIIYIVGAPLLVAAVSLIANGTVYFLLGYIGILAVIVLYPIFKRVYGGWHTNDPEKYPLNPKTKLGQGDIGRMGLFLIMFGAIAFFASFGLAAYEGSYGVEYYGAMFGTDTLMGDFWGMINVTRYLGVIMAVAGGILKLIGMKFDPIKKDND